MSVKFIAEVGSNHNRDLKRCRRFIEMAADLGCWGVKFQLFRVDSLFAPEVLALSDQRGLRLNERRAWELPLEFVPELARHCREQNLKFVCTPFDLEAVELLKPHVDSYKIASYDILRLDLLRACAATGKPMIMSTGMATDMEIGQALFAVTEETKFKANLTLLHCVSLYPTPVDACDLSKIDHFRRLGFVKTGWSDHSVNPGVIYRAVHQWCVSVVEFHLDLDSQGAEYGYGHCWLPEQIAPVIRGVYDGFKADFRSEDQVRVEDVEREWRADPSDGLRPMRGLRKKLVEGR